MQEFNIDPAFGQIVDQAIKQHGDTRASAAVKMEISPSMLSDLITGRPRNYSMLSLKKICEYANLSADAVLGLSKLSDKDENVILQTVSYVTGLSIRSIELLAQSNQSRWAIESGRIVAAIQNDNRCAVTNELFGEQDTYRLIAMITRYFNDVKYASEDAEPPFDAEAIAALDILEKHGYKAISRIESAQLQRKETVAFFDELLKSLSGESEQDN